jgi:hypothetical protein
MQNLPGSKHIGERDKGTHDPTIIEPEFTIETYGEYMNKAMEK